MTNVLIVGYKGFVGSAIQDAMLEDDFFSVIGIGRGDELPGLEFDVVVNANGNSRKYWANNNPLEDFDASVRSVYRVARAYPGARHVFVSSLDALKDEPYGQNKRIAEGIVKDLCREHFILRCASVIGRGMSKGVVLDVLNGSPLFVTPDSRIQFITSKALALTIKALAKREGLTNMTYNAGGRGGISPDEVGEILGVPVSYSKHARHQHFDYDVEELSSLYGLKSSREYVRSLRGGIE